MPTEHCVDLDGVGITVDVDAGLTDSGDQFSQTIGHRFTGEVAVGQSRRAPNRGRGVAADQDRNVRPLCRPRRRGEWLEVDEVTVKLDIAAGPDGAHRCDVLVVACAAPLPRDTERIELFLHPADADAQLDPAAGEVVQRGQFLREHQGVALRQDQDAGAQSQRRRCGSDVGQPDQWIRNRRLRSCGNLSIGRVRIGRRDRRRHDDMFAAPHRLESHRLGNPGDLQRRDWIGADTAGKGESEFHGPFEHIQRPL